MHKQKQFMIWPHNRLLPLPTHTSRINCGGKMSCAPKTQTFYHVSASTWIQTNTSHTRVKKDRRIGSGKHHILGILVGASIQQQPRALRVTPLSGQNQRRPSALRTHIFVTIFFSARSVTRAHFNTHATSMHATQHVYKHKFHRK
jgi:hypothetical protein